MISLIIGKKGSGKTKRLIDLANTAVENSKGNVVCVEKGKKLTYDVSHKARLVDIDSYGVTGFSAFFGFLAGICAGNYDVTDVIVDATLKIGGKDYDEFADFIEKLAKISECSDTKFTFTVSCDESDLPKRVFDVSTKL